MNSQVNKEESCVSEEDLRGKPINYFSAWCVPGVPLYAIAYACLKSSIYGLLFWLPAYISENGMN